MTVSKKYSLCKVWWWFFFFFFFSFCFGWNLGIVGRAYYDAAQIQLRRNRYLIRAARTQNMLLHSAFFLLQQKEQVARKEASNLTGMRKQAMALRLNFDQQRKKAIAQQIAVSEP